MPATAPQEEYPDLEALTNMRASRRSTRPAPTIKSVANDNDLKKEEIENNPYLARGKFSNVDQNASAQITKNLADSISSPIHEAQTKKKVANESTQNQNRETKIRKNTGQENMDRVRALGSAANDNNDISVNANLGKKKRQAQIKAVQNVFKERKMDITNHEAKVLIKNGFKHSFPAALFSVSLFKDITDPVLTTIGLAGLGLGLVGITSVVGTPVGAAVAGTGTAVALVNTLIISPTVAVSRMFMNRVYLKKLMGDVGLARKVSRHLFVGNFATTTAEMLPVVQALPVYTVRVLRLTGFTKKLMREAERAAAQIK
jgi:hypothetical protein